MAKKKTQDAAYLLEKTRLLLDGLGKKEKTLYPCKVCKKDGKLLYRGVCEDCRKNLSGTAAEKRSGKTWTSPDGYVRVYDEHGKPQLYARRRMAELLGRPLEDSEMVTYKDGNRSNVNDENLNLASKPSIS